MDLSLTISKKLCESKKENSIKIAEALESSIENHRQLNIPNNIQDIKRTFSYARTQLNEQAFVELYSIFADYIANIIKELCNISPTKLFSIISPSSDKAIEFSKIVQLGDYPSIMDEMARRIFRILENARCTKTMLDKLMTVTDVSVDGNLKKEALLYLEIRHLIIHNDTKEDDKFRSCNSDGIVKVNLSNHKIKMNYNLANTALTVVFMFCKRLDEALLEKGLVNARP